MDLVYVGVTFGFFGLSWGLIAFCDRLHQRTAGEAAAKGAAVMTVFYGLGALVSVALLAYLFVALLDAEKF